VTISLLACLIGAGTALGQTPAGAPLAWHPTGTPTPAIQQAQFQLPAQPRIDKVPAPQAGEKPPARIDAPLGFKIRTAEDDAEFSVQTTPPGLDRLTRRVSETEFDEILRQEARRRPGLGRIYFPDEEPVSTEPYTGRNYPFMPRPIEPQYVVHKPLLFEQKTFERYGWDLGPLTPAANFGLYYYDLVMLPYHVGSQACHCLDTNAGKCLPGDAVPFLVYRETFSVTGLVFETGAILGGLFVFP
jgi:hypothetical protein